MIKIKIYKTLLTVLIISGSFSSKAQDPVTVYPTEYPNALSNPLKGFRPNLSSAGDPNYPYPTIVRDYIKWNQIENNPSDGVQKIIDFCNNRWQGLEGMNVKVIPRIYIDWDSKDANEFWPADIVDSLGWDTWDVKYWKSELVKRRVVELIYKLGEAWDNDPRVAWIQTGLVGYWGEQENPVGVDEDGWAKRLGEAFDSAFKNKQLIVRNQPSWDAEGYKWGVYWDSYGHPGQRSGAWSRIQQTNAQGRYLTEIIEGEVAYNWGESSFDPLYGGEPEITLNSTAYTDNMIDVIRELHCTGLGWIASYDLDGSFGTDPEKIKANASRMQKAFGYRYIMPEFSCTSRVDQGGVLDIGFKVKNTGSAPFYKKWPVAFTLIDESTKQIIWTEIISDIDITKWLPGDKYNYTTRVYNTPAPEYQIDASITIPDNIPTGQYMVGISILDPSTLLPGIFFALENFLSESQSQPLCRMGIGEELIGSHDIDPAIFGDPLLDDARIYSMSETSNMRITYPTDGASFSAPADVTVYVSALKKNGTIDSVELYVDGVLEHTLYSSPYIFNVSNLVVGSYSFEAKAYDDEGAVQSDIISVIVSIPGGLPWLENFDLPNGTKSDEGETAWTSSRGGGIFEVSNKTFAISDGINNIGKFTTEIIDIAAAPVTVSLEVEATGSGLDKGQDYVKLYKIIDGGAEVFIDMVDGQESKSFSESNITGETLQLIIRGYTTYSGEVYQCDNLSVTYDVPVPTKDITVQVSGNGAVNPSVGLHSYYEGQTIALFAIPSFGYEFESWSGDLSGTANPGEIIMDTDKTVMANFIELPKYSLTTSATNGSISLSESGDTFYKGTQLTLTATPDPGYEFNGWSGDLAGSDNTVSLTMDGDKNISALFVEIPSYTLTLIATNGSVSLDPDGGSYFENTEVSLTATADPDYEFSGWGGDTSGTTNPLSITMNGDMSITANFDLIIGVGVINLPMNTNLGQNYPNPFGAQTTIPYQISSASHVKLSIYNILGEQLHTLVNDYQNSGLYTVDFDLTDIVRDKVPGAIYFYRLETDNHIYMKKFIHGQ